MSPATSAPRTGRSAETRLWQALDKRKLSACWDERRIEVLTGNFGHPALGLDERGIPHCA